MKGKKIIYGSLIILGSLSNIQAGFWSNTFDTLAKYERINTKYDYFIKNSKKQLKEYISEYKTKPSLKGYKKIEEQFSHILSLMLDCSFEKNLKDFSEYDAYKKDIVTPQLSELKRLLPSTDRERKVTP